SNFRGCVLLFSCQVPVRCFLSEATLIVYHSFFCLSTTFFISFLLSLAATRLYYHSAPPLSTAFFIFLPVDLTGIFSVFYRRFTLKAEIKIRKRLAANPQIYLLQRTEKEGFEPSRRYK